MAGSQSARIMTVNLRVWKQASANAPGRLVSYTVNGVSSDMSFLEMLDLLNQQLVEKGEDPIAFASDCREGLCGTCGCMINGQAHGPEAGSATCQLHMRSFKDGDEIVVEPFRARAFPVVRDLIVDRKALDSIIQAGGYTSAKTGKHADANSMLIPKDIADKAMDAAQCIGCGACVAACPNASVSLFMSAKITHLALMPQGKADSERRVQRMVDRMDEHGFGACSNIGECSAVCPKSIPLDVIATMKREFMKVTLSTKSKGAGAAGGWG